jgi:CHAT domain
VAPSGVRVVALPGLTADAAIERANGYLRTLQEAEQARERRDAARQQARAGASMAGRQVLQQAERTLRAAGTATESMLTDVLGWLWEVVAEPVLLDLGFRDRPPDGEWPRLWWCPAGPLTLLPLHAAGRHGAAGRPSSSAVIDRVISSYTPTVRALMEARRPLPAQPPDAGQLLVVAQATAPGMPPLAGVAAELDMLADLIPDQHRTVLDGAAAIRAAVRAALARHPWAHFSCHARQDLARPSQGGFALHDGMLAVTDIAEQQYQAEFAGLFACQTATGGTGLLDEAIKLAAALHYTGYRHVIGTFWSVSDSAPTIELIGNVYRHVTVDGSFRPDRSARALHQATRSLRDSYPDHPSVWTSFAHTGP